MPFTLLKSPRRRGLRQRLTVLAGAMIALSSFAVAAAEVHLKVEGTFKPPAPEQTALFPVEGGIDRADLAKGTWSMAVVYDDTAADVDPDPHVGRFPHAIRSARLTIGDKTIELPVGRAEIVVSDGGHGFSYRESIKVVVQAPLPAGPMRLSWVQLFTQQRDTDLRGTAGLLSGDAMPTAAQMANFPTTQPFDRFLELRVDSPAGAARPLLYLSSSELSAIATTHSPTH